MLKLEPHKQKYDFSCGPACLKMALEYYGIFKPEDYLIKLSGCSKVLGIKASKLLKAAKKLGLDGFIKDNSNIKDVRVNLDKNKIVIVEWFYEDDSHFSIVRKIEENRIYLYDTYTGKILVKDINIFKRIWFNFDIALIKKKSDVGFRRMLVLYKDQK